MNNRPCIFVSKCIEQDHCRYDGSQISSPFVKKLDGYVDIVTICPEVAIGLPIPRESIRIISMNDEQRLIHSKSGQDETEAMMSFTEKYVKALTKNNVQGFILKNRSPSCGIKDVKVYPGPGKVMCLDLKTEGVFARGILKEYEGYAIEDEGRLLNYNIREHFLTRVFTMFDYQQVLEKRTMKSLVDFQSKNKYLLMAYSQINQKKLGKIVANHSGEAIDKVLLDYKRMLLETLSHQMTRGTNINVLMHVLGYFKKVVNRDEKAHFIDVLGQYEQKKVPFSVPVAILYSWVIRFDEVYLKTQTIFRPYPLEILDVSDSGKGID